MLAIMWIAVLAGVVIAVITAALARRAAAAEAARIAGRAVDDARAEAAAQIQAARLEAAGVPTLYASGLPSTRRLELVSAKPLRCGAVAVHYRRAQ